MLYDNGDDNLLNSAKPEESQASQADIYMYSGILSEGLNMGDLKQLAEDSHKEASPDE